MKLHHTFELIWTALEEAKRPAAMLSFGKDSMVLAHLIRDSGWKGDFPHAQQFPVDVIYHRDPWFPWKHKFAEDVINKWGMEVHDYPPMQCGVKVKADMLELVARYNFGNAAMDIPKNVEPPEAYPRRDYLCGLNDWMERPKNFLLDYPWDTVFLGHRSADVDPFEGHVPLKDYEAEVGGIRMVFPLRDWTDDELWEFIEDEDIEVQSTRYKGRKEIKDKWYNNDYAHACTRCIDPREVMAEVFCPKLKRMVKNRGMDVLQLHAQPHYVER